MFSIDAIWLLMMSPFFWTTGEFIAFCAAYLFVRGKLGGVIATLLKIVVIIIVTFACILFIGLYMYSRHTHPEAVATVTAVENDAMMGGYSQKLTLEYTYDDKKYVVKELDTINLQAEKGDKYIVHFSNRTPDQLKFIKPDDKAPTAWQILKKSITYAIIGIIVFLIAVNVIRRRI